MKDDEQTLLQLLGYVFLQCARPDKAAVVLAALDVLRPGQAKVLLGLATAQLRTQKPASALETLDRLAMAGGVNAAFHLLRGQALSQLERPQEAAAAMKSYMHLRQAAATQEAVG